MVGGLGLIFGLFSLGHLLREFEGALLNALFEFIVGLLQRLLGQFFVCDVSTVSNNRKS